VYCNVLCRTVLYCTVLYCNVLFVVLYCNILYLYCIHLSCEVWSWPLSEQLLRVHAHPVVATLHQIPHFRSAVMYIYL